MKHQLLVDFIERGLVLGSGDIVAVARHAHKAVRDTDGLHDDKRSSLMMIILVVSIVLVVVIIVIVIVVIEDGNGKAEIKL